MNRTARLVLATAGLTVALALSPAALAGATDPAAQADQTAPQLSAAQVVYKTIHALYPAPTSASGQGPVIALRYMASEATTVKFSVLRSGRRHRLAAFQTDAQAGINTTDLPRSVAAKLAAGRYVVELLAQDAAGNQSAPLQVHMRVRTPQTNP